MKLEMRIGIFQEASGNLYVAADPDAYSKEYLIEKKVVGNLLLTMEYQT